MKLIHLTADRGLWRAHVKPRGPEKTGNILSMQSSVGFRIRPLLYAVRYIVSWFVTLLNNDFFYINFITKYHSFFLSLSRWCHIRHWISSVLKSSVDPALSLRSCLTIIHKLIPNKCFQCCPIATKTEVAISHTPHSGIPLATWTLLCRNQRKLEFHVVRKRRYVHNR